MNRSKRSSGTSKSSATTPERSAGSRGPPSRGASRMKGGLGSVIFDSGGGAGGGGGGPLFSRSSRIFLGSKASLQNSSKRNLASESLRALRPQAKVYDEDGYDVTPLNLIDEEHSVTKRSQMIFLKPDKENPTPNVSIFQNSVYGSHFVGPATASLIQPFSKSMFSASTTDMAPSSLSISVTEDFRNLPPDRQDVPRDDTTASDSFERLKEEIDLEKEVEIVLSESETIYMLDIRGTCVDLSSEEAETVKASNEKYEKLLKSHSGNDNYMERGVQTINDAPKFKQVQTDTVKKEDVGVMVSTWDMHNTYEALKDEEVLSEVEETLEELNSRVASRMADASGGTTFTPSAKGERVKRDDPSASTRIPGESTIAVSMIESGGACDNPNIVPKRKSEDKWDPTIPNQHPILKMDSLKDRFRTVERAIMQNNYHLKQAMYRNIDPIEDPDYPASGFNVNINTPHLDKLWTYSCPLTRRRKVTCMAWNHFNQDIMAVGYGTFTAEEDCMGLICCWSLKNPEFPERIFHAPSGITSLSFSHKNPNLLAAGLFTGSILLYNARSTEHESVLDSRDALHKHSAPVWQINWVTKEHNLGESKSENLISISTDGHVLQWSIRKGFESAQLMNLKRMLTNKQQAKKAKSKPIVNPTVPKHAVSAKPQMGGGEAYISQHAPGMGFDFWPKDSNIYLACTDEGFIHKCSCSYNEQVLETYVGHTGPVYRVSWSPFVTDYFLSCSADWSVKLWAQDKTEPLQSFSAAQKGVNDICWSPFNSTLFGCVSESRVEIWNLEYSSLDPLIVYRPLSNAALTCISFAQNSKVVLVGDTDGEVVVYRLSNLQSPPTNPEEALLAAIRSMLRKDHAMTSTYSHRRHKLAPNNHV